MTNEKWIALLGFVVTALGILGAFGPLAEYSAYFNLIAALVGAFMAAWFGVKPIYQQRKRDAAFKAAAIERANKLIN
jgi:uncharacterized membrane protein YbaN (DUF454 family)